MYSDSHLKEYRQIPTNDYRTIPVNNLMYSDSHLKEYRQTIIQLFNKKSTCHCFTTTYPPKTI
jgi:hypothetical protein